VAEDPQERILRLHVNLELRDYFRYYLDSIKRKLLIAGIIYAVVTAGFVYFFALIGESLTLLETSPLFVGFPAVAIIGQLLRAHASHRKYLASLSEEEKSLDLVFRDPGNGYDVVTGDNFYHVGWRSVRRVVEKPCYFQFCFNKYESFVIHKRFLRYDSEQDVLRQILRLGVVSKAQLLRSNEA